MTTPAVAWSTAADVTAGPCADLSDADDVARLDANLLIATQLLFLRTGRRWPGVVTDSYRPNPGGCGCSWGRPGCTRVPEVKLPGYPVVAILSVLIDGVEVDPFTYRIDDKRYLVRLPDPDTDRNDGWPCCQRMDLALTDDHTFGLTYTWGSLPDHAGIAAQQRLGCELTLAGDPATAGACKLPVGVLRAITRQGVSIEVAQGINLANCGLPEVTLWLDALEYDRNGTGSPAVILDPSRLARQGRRARRTPSSAS